MKSVIETIKNEKGIIIAFGILFTFALCCWLYFDTTKDFGLNFFTEMLGAAITVLILDQLIKRREERKNIPLKLAIYEDVRLYTSRYISFWKQTYLDSVPEPVPENVTVFFSEQGMSKIIYYLYMDSEPNVAPRRYWWDYIIQNAKEFNENGDKILNRYSHNLEPEVFKYIHQLTESDFNRTLLMIPAIRQIDDQHNFPRVKVLCSYSIEPIKEDYEAIIALINWCESKFAKLQEHSLSLKRVAIYTPVAERILPPKCMIPEEILQKQQNELLEFRNRTK